MAELQGKELEEHLKRIVSMTEESTHNIWVCSGDGKNPHHPIISYGWCCPFCDTIGELNFDVSEKEKEREEFERELRNALEKIEVLDDDATERDSELQDAVEKRDEYYEKLMDAYERYPELGI